MVFILSIAAICWLIGVYFNCKVWRPIIEQDGDAWVIRIGNRFVDYDRMYNHPSKDLVLVSGHNVLDYSSCKIFSKERAELFFKHVCDYTAEGKVRYL